MMSPVRRRGSGRGVATRVWGGAMVSEEEPEVGADIQQLQRKLEHYHRKLREVEQHGIPRQPKDVLRTCSRA
ncbi:hypothetical protein CRUP_017994 [Coryphaenoides rupestris]|nr:hypothetical protein CRUP_017994 [Coryphaenoides rupestris]